MSKRQIALLVMIVVLLHGGIFLFFAKSRSLPNVKTCAVDLPNFVGKERAWQDKETGEHFVYREFRVSTKLAFPDVLMEQKSPEAGESLPVFNVKLPSPASAAASTEIVQP